MLNSIAAFIYQHPFISGFILYWGSWRWLKNHQPEEVAPAEVTVTKDE